MEKNTESVSLPILAMRDIVVLPGMLVHLDINRVSSKQAVKMAMEGNGEVFITAQRDSSKESPAFYDLYDIGVTASIKQEVKLKDNIVRVMISTKKRAKLEGLVERHRFILFQPDIRQFALCEQERRIDQRSN